MRGQPGDSRVEARTKHIPYSKHAQMSPIKTPSSDDNAIGQECRLKTEHFVLDENCINTDGDVHTSISSCKCPTDTANDTPKDQPLPHN